MTGASPTAFIGAAILALTVLLGIWRATRNGYRGRSIQVWLQIPAAVLLYLALFPPSVPLHQQSLVVLAPGISAEQLAHLPWNQVAVALSDVPAPASIEREPDLATALRKHPATTRVELIGGAVPARDRQSISTIPFDFKAAPEKGLVELHAPAKIPLGTQWLLRGRVAGGVARIELRDPSGALVDSAVPDGNGRFQVSTIARGVGESVFQLRALDAKQVLIDHAGVPLQVEAGEHLSVIVRAGALDADLKYWRRWAADAGLSVRANVGLSEGIALHDGDAQLTRESLAQADLAIVDERAWLNLGADEKTALAAAVVDGLGLLLRVTGPVDPAVAADWATLGYTISADDTDADGNAAVGVALDHALGLRDRADFSRAAVAVNAPAAAIMLAADDGTALVWWRTQGRGRIGLWRLLDSYHLQLLGESGRYGGLWAQTLAALARPRQQAQEPPLPLDNWVGQRSVLCDLGTAAQVQPRNQDQNAAPVDLLVDAHRCAAYWPTVAGWQQVLSGGSARPLYVRAEDDAAGLRMARDRGWTEAQQLSIVDRPNATLKQNPSDPDSRESVPEAGARRIELPRWPFFVAWLLLIAGLWWRERPMS